MDTLRSGRKLTSESMGAKRGMMVIVQESSRLTQGLATWEIEGHSVPIVEEYTHVGTNFHRTILTYSMMSGRPGSARKSVENVAPLLFRASFPVPLMVSVVKPPFTRG